MESTDDIILQGNECLTFRSNSSNSHRYCESSDESGDRNEYRKVPPSRVFQIATSSKDLYKYFVLRNAFPIILPRHLIQRPSRRDSLLIISHIMNTIPVSILRTLLPSRKIFMQSPSFRSYPLPHMHTFLSQGRAAKQTLNPP